VVWTRHPLYGAGAATTHRPTPRPAPTLAGVRALYIANPLATTTTSRTREIIASVLGTRLHFDDVVQTAYRGHGRELARDAAKSGVDLVVVLGGDGTVNEVVNGLRGAPVPDPPALAVIPGGSANVFARGLGIPADPLQATRVLLQRLSSASRRSIALGRVRDADLERYFTFNVGFGLDAAVIAEMERWRARGFRASPARYAACATRVLLGQSAANRATFRLHLPEHGEIRGLHTTLVTNMTPWTYAGPIPLQPTPRSRPEGGLDVFALTRPDLRTVAWTLLQMARKNGAPAEGDGYLTHHELSRFSVHADVPSPCHIDGDFLGMRIRLDFDSVPDALQVVA
jgi:diacylglycerol kinase family enzyme